MPFLAAWLLFAQTGSGQWRIESDHHLPIYLLLLRQDLLGFTGVYPAAALVSVDGAICGDLVVFVRAQLSPNCQGLVNVPFNGQSLAQRI
jgi:hypothetical protein